MKKNENKKILTVIIALMALIIIGNILNNFGSAKEEVEEETKKESIVLSDGSWIVLRKGETIDNYLIEQESEFKQLFETSHLYGYRYDYKEDCYIVTWCCDGDIVTHQVYERN